MSKLKVLICFITVLNLFVSGLFSQEKSGNDVFFNEYQQKLRITAEDVLLIPEEDKKIGGYHLYIRKLPNVQSVLLTETTKDPNGKSDNYTYRAKEYNKVNGDEIRILDGQPLNSDGAKYSLVDSSVENTDFFGPAFHIYIPPVIVYGYPWTRNGEIKIEKGTFVNIRSFDKPFADYTGNYMDSPFMFDVITIKKNPKLTVTSVDEPPVEKNPDYMKSEEPSAQFNFDDLAKDLSKEYNHVASAMLKEISNDISYSKGPETIVDDIIKVFEKGNFKDDLDVVFAIDATGSMKNDINKLKADLLPALEKYFGDDSNTRIGLLFYRDYGDTFNYKNLPVMFFDFTTDFNTFAKNLNSIRITGLEGGDVPEAVYEAIYAATKYLNWRPDADRQIVIIGDAEPHPTPRGTGKYSKDYVMAFADFMGVSINTILLPQD